MKITENEMNNLLFVRDKCKLSSVSMTDFEDCKDCPYFEGYCHFSHYLRTQVNVTEDT